jgi:hypothetical protein
MIHLGLEDKGEEEDCGCEQEENSNNEELKRLVNELMDKLNKLLS